MVTEKTPLGTVVVPVEKQFRGFEATYNGNGQTLGGEADWSGFNAIVKTALPNTCFGDYKVGQHLRGLSRTAYYCQHLKFQADKILKKYKADQRKLRLKCVKKLKVRKAQKAL